VSAPASPMTRWKAGAFHLAVSLAVIGSIAAFVWLYWLPHGLWPLALKRPLLILSAAVLLVGPLLTTLVYRTGKRTLRSDLLVVTLIQLVFLAYCLFMLGRTRPVFLVAAVDRFELVMANDIDRKDLKAAPAPYRYLPWTGPQLVGLRNATDDEQGGELLLAGLTSADTPLRPAFYTAIAESVPTLLQRSRPLGELTAHSAHYREVVLAALVHLGRNGEQVRFLPITSRHGSAVMLIDPDTAAPLRLLSLDPWPGVEAGSK